MRVLIGYDGSAAAEHAIADLQRAGLPAEGTALVVCVADVLPPAPVASEAHASPARDKAKQLAQGRLTEARALAEAGARSTAATLSGWSVSGEAVPDSPFWGLIKRAESWSADLIVVGAQGKSALTRFALGSVSMNVVAHASCSVRIARKPRRQEQQPARLVVGVDGSRGSAAAVRQLYERRWPPGSRVSVVAAVDGSIETALAASVDPFVFQWSRPIDDDPQQWIRRAVDAALAEQRPALLEAEPVVLSGDPKRVLVEHAEQIDADCIFMGAQGLTRVERMLLGSVSASVATHAQCSVEVVRRKEA